MTISLIKRISVRLLILSYLGCVIVFASAYFAPDKYLVISILHLLVPFCIIFLLISVVTFLLLRHWKFLIFSILVLALNLGNLRSFFGYSDRTLTPETSFEVLSYNVSFFNIPSVFSKEYFDSTSASDGNKILQWIADRNSPVVCLQEFFTDGESSHHNYTDKLIAEGYQVNIFALANAKNDTRRGLVTCTKFPVVGSGQVFISSNRYNGAGYTDLLINQDTIRIINVHLQSMELYFGNKGFWDKAKHFWIHYKKAMAIRTEQVKQLNNFISESSYPVILAGDFNETPFSYNHKVLKARLTNSFEFSGRGLGSTFHESLMPIRIDHQYFSSELTCGNFKVNRSLVVSDHFPIHARYQRVE